MDDVAVVGCRLLLILEAVVDRFEGYDGIALMGDIFIKSTPCSRTIVIPVQLIII